MAEGGGADGRPFPYHLEWGVVWRYVLLRPSLATFRWLLSDPKAERQRGYRWVFTVALLVSVPIYLRVHFMLMTQADYARIFGEIYGRAIPAALLLGSALATVLVRLNGGLLWLAAWLLGGRPNYNASAYLSATYSAPLLAIAGAIALLPLADGLVLALWAGLWLWGWALTIGAAMAAGRLGFWRAMLAASLLPLVLAGAAAFVVAALSP